MSFAAEAGAIERRFALLWGTTTPIAWSNVAAPDAGGPPAPWVRLALRAGGARVVALGAGPVTRHDGEIVLAIYVPAGTGDRGLRALADQADAIFAGRTFEGVACGPARLGPAEIDGAWCRADLVVPYRRDAGS